MTRQELSKIMAECRTSSGLLMKNICFKLNCMPRDVYRLDKGTYNYNLQKCLDYLAALGQRMVIADINNKDTAIKDYNNLVSYIIRERNGSYSQRGLAEAVGCSHIMIALFETGKTTITIDSLLKICEVLHLTIKVEPYE